MHQMVTMAGSASPQSQPNQQAPPPQPAPSEMVETKTEPPVESMETETPAETAIEHGAPPSDRETDEANADVPTEPAAATE